MTAHNVKLLIKPAGCFHVQDAMPAPRADRAPTVTMSRFLVTTYRTYFCPYRQRPHGSTEGTLRLSR